MNFSENEGRITEQDIKRLINEAVSDLGANRIYGESLRYLDLEKMKTESEKHPLTTEELRISFSVAGFMAGINFALSNIMVSPDDPED